MNGNTGKFVIKCIKWVKSSFGCALFVLRWEIFLHWGILKGQCVMLIKWENFGAFLT